MHFPPDYPFKARNVSFNTKIFHPNVGVYGNFFLKMLKNEYFSPIYTINRVRDEVDEEEVLGLQFLIEVDEEEVMGLIKGFKSEETESFKSATKKKNLIKGFRL
ncbi:hypothetical protein EUTSA_v10002313mg [Eutrema salsugineum]|uniref:UBC core domain-containing protein n=1 Tax=Eutrema salsugineum TaxID=72664 RepID=V4M1T4_EUTSA|nr:hypothetical protein EUTSA_v10002313mg [Eutrema salsugineum]